MLPQCFLQGISTLLDACGAVWAQAATVKSRPREQRGRADTRFRQARGSSRTEADDVEDLVDQGGWLEAQHLAGAVTR